MEMKTKPKSSKIKTLLEGLLIAFVVFVICFFVMMSWVNSRFNDFYWTGYGDGRKACDKFGIKGYDNPFGTDIEGAISSSVNLSGLNIST